MYSEIWTVCGYHLRRLLRLKVLIGMACVFILLLLTINGAAFLQLLAYIFWTFTAPMPITLLIPYYALIVVMPILAVVFTNGLFAKPLEEKSVEFELLRIKRISYVFGKICATMIFHSVFVILVMVAAWAYTYYQLRSLSLGSALWLTTALLIYTWMLVSLYALVSAFTGRQDRSLQLSMALTFILGKFLIIGPMQRFTPFWYAAQVVGGSGIPLVFWAAIFITTLSGTVVIFERKQL